MTRALQFINFVGVLALAALCGLQWKADRRLNLELIESERTRIRQVGRIAERDRTIQGNMADLAEFRERLGSAEAQLKDLQLKLNAALHERDDLTVQKAQLVAQLDQLKAILEKWTAAVAARDAALKKAGDQAATLLGERDEAVKRFNDLAVKHNALVNDWNTRRAATRPASAP